MNWVPFYVFWGGLHSQHMVIARLRVELELQLLAYTIATASWDPSPICNLHSSSQQCCILTQQSEKGSNPCSHGY